MSKVLVLTGCAGFIGFNFLKHACRSDVFKHYDEVISIDKMGYASKYNETLYGDLCEKYKITRIDCNINDLKPMEHKKDTTFDVVDFASESHVDNSIAAPELIFLENSQLPVNLLKIFPKELIRKFIHISTDEVYGELEYGCEYSDWFKAGDPISPNNPYSASKVAQDAYLMSIRHTFGLNVQFVRMANQFGPHQHPEKMFPATILRVLKGETIKIYGTGENIRQWTPVVQTVQVIYDLLFSNGNDDVLIAKHYRPLFNNNEIVDIWRGILDSQHNLKSEIEYIGDRQGHDTMYALQTTERVRSYFNTVLGEEFANTIDHYIKNKDLYIDQEKSDLVKDVEKIIEDIPEETKKELDKVEEAKKATDEVKKVAEEVKKSTELPKREKPLPKPRVPQNKKPIDLNNIVIKTDMVDR